MKPIYRATAILCAVVLCGCGQSVVQAMQNEADVLTFRTIGEADYVPHVKVFLVEGDRVTEIGSSGRDSTFAIEKSRLERKGHTALYFCLHSLKGGCTAIVATDWLLEFDELHVLATGGISNVNVVRTER